MIEKKLRAKLESLEKKRELATSTMLKQEYATLINLVRKSELIFNEYHAFLDSLSKKDNDKLITDWENLKKLRYELLEQLKESSIDAYYSELELQKTFDDSFKQSIEYNRSINELNNVIVSLAKEMSEATFEKALSENNIDVVIESIIKISKTIAGMGNPLLAVILTARDISKIRKNSINTADNILYDIELQKALFTNINEKYSIIVNKYKYKKTNA